MDSKSLLESMRNDNANLKAEKNLFDSIKQRQLQEIEHLTLERTRLNGLISNLQAVQTERERSDSEARRRLQSQVERLETELTANKRRLNEEVEESKKMMIRKEGENKAAQLRLDELNASLATIKEELASSQTTRDHLQTRVDDLTITLKSAEDKLAIYQAKPTTTAAPEEDEDDTIEEMKVEIADLKKEIKIFQGHLTTMTDDVDKYMTIAKEKEEEFDEFMHVHDEYKNMMENQVLEDEVCHRLH